MFLLLIIVLLTALFLTGTVPDQYGWTMLLGLSWLAGFLDCRLFARSDRDKDRVMPPDANEPFLDDQNTFQS